MRVRHRAVATVFTSAWESPSPQVERGWLVSYPGLVPPGTYRKRNAVPDTWGPGGFVLLVCDGCRRGHPRLRVRPALLEVHCCVSPWQRKNYASGGGEEERAY